MKQRIVAIVIVSAALITAIGCGNKAAEAPVAEEAEVVAEVTEAVEEVAEDTAETEEVAEEVTEEVAQEVAEETPAQETATEEVATEETTEEAPAEESKPAEEAKPVETKPALTIPDWFDAEFYAANNSDVVAALGSGADALYNHYVTYGKAEGRKANADDPAEPVVTANSGNESNNNDSAGSNNSSSVVVDTNIPSYDEFVNTMLADVNALRREQGVGDLVLDEQCNNVGNLRANEIATYFSHTRPDGRSFYTAWEDLGYEHPNVGENLSKYMIGGETLSLSQAAHDTFDIFSDSPTHYENMIKAKWTKVYFNVYIIQDGSRTYYYCVQTFSK